MEFSETEPIRIKIDELKRKLEGSAVLQSNKHGLKILLDDIAQNRHRVQAILTRMADADGEEALSFTLKQLAREELLSEEHYLILVDALLEEFNYSRLVDVIKGTKIVQGLKFLPRKLADLTKNFQIWLE